MPRVTLFNKVRLITLTENGMSQRQIAQILNLPKSSVNSIIQKYRQRGTVERQPGSGRHRISTIEEDEALVNTVRLNPFTNAINAVAVIFLKSCIAPSSVNCSSIT
jgi:transposase